MVSFSQVSDPLIEWFLSWGTRARDDGWQPKKRCFFVVVVGRKISVLYAKANDFYVFNDWTAL